MIEIIIFFHIFRAECEKFKGPLSKYMYSDELAIFKAALQLSGYCVLPI